MRPFSLSFPVTSSLYQKFPPAGKAAVDAWVTEAGFDVSLVCQIDPDAIPGWVLLGTWESEDGKPGKFVHAVAWCGVEVEVIHCASCDGASCEPEDYIP